MLEILFMLLTDGYKLDHRRQYPRGTRFVYSNLTARKGRNPQDAGVVAFGFQYFLLKFFGQLAKITFFDLDEDDACRQYQEFLDDYMPGNTIGTDHIRALHRLGYFPLEIRALPEGSFVPYGVPMLTIENTHPDFFWLTNYFETLISSVLWKPITSATTARSYRKILNEAVGAAGVPAEFVPFQAHDFSFRGMSGPDDAARSGAGHLLSFTGTDCLPAVNLLRRYYDARGFVGGTVPATEHSVMCAGGDEYKTFKRLLTEVYPDGLVSIVSDTWDLWYVLTHVVPSLHEEIMLRPGTLVIRPDSGDPVKIICGDPDAPEGTPARKGVVELLWDEFGGVTNDKGYRFLDSHVGAIYGDSITPERATAIRDGLMAKGFVPMVVLGVGSFTYQYVTRDSHGMAVKSTHTQRDGEEFLIWKDPVTDRDANGNSTKTSAKGRVVVREDPLYGYQLIDNLHLTEWLELQPIDCLKPIWRNGVLLERTNLEEIRARVAAHT